MSELKSLTWPEVSRTHGTLQCLLLSGSSSAPHRWWGCVLYWAPESPTSSDSLPPPTPPSGIARPAETHMHSKLLSHSAVPQRTKVSSKCSSPCCLPDWPHTPCRPLPACRWRWIHPSTPASCSTTGRDAVEPEAATSTATKHVCEKSQTLPVWEFLLAGGFLQEVIVCLSECVQETFFNQLVQVLCFPWKKNITFHPWGRPSLFLFKRSKGVRVPLWHHKRPTCISACTE